MLYTKHNYLNKNIQFLVSNEIIEYDMTEAGYNLVKQFQLLDDHKMQILARLGKQGRKVKIGLYQRADREFSRRLSEKFVEARRLFFEANNVQEEDVLSIKKDAILMIKPCSFTNFGHIQFLEKNVYTSYYNLNHKEFYYSRDGVDVKGINDKLLVLHREYMLDFLYNFSKMNETAKKARVISMIREFSQYYKERRLNIGYYRELSHDSLFRLNGTYFNQAIGVERYSEVKDLNIGYNFIHYVTPLISLLV